MTPLVTPSPVMLDQSFPRDRRELITVAVAIGNLDQIVRDNDMHLLLTDALATYVEEFDWKSSESWPQLLDIHRLLNQWFLQPHAGIVTIDTEETSIGEPHPLPSKCKNQGNTIIWAEEMGKLLVMHDTCIERDEFFIGVVCIEAFSNESNVVDTYFIPTQQRVFPLVGPLDVHSILADAYFWEVPENANSWLPTARDIEQNYIAIGATSCEKPRRDSHCKIHFNAKRAWTFSQNDDKHKIGRYLHELEEITGLPLIAIKYALTKGELPPKRLKLSRLTL